MGGDSDSSSSTSSNTSYTNTYTTNSLNTTNSGGFAGNTGSNVLGLTSLGGGNSLTSSYNSQQNVGNTILSNFQQSLTSLGAGSPLSASGSPAIGSPSSAGSFDITQYLPWLAIGGVFLVVFLMRRH